MFVLVNLLRMKYPINCKTDRYGVPKSNCENLVSKLKKNFKKSSKNYHNFSHFFFNLGFIQSKTNPCVYLICCEVLFTDT